ncbi:hypothetical protein LTR49_025832 [Elasticomyces elasticus]|nr:hypothetical protein LTR49_025832 [Elasticomyces elasticus]
MDESVQPQQADAIVIGAGIYGIQAARTYLEIHLTQPLAICEGDSCVSGPWNARRGYEGFMTQSPIDFLEFSDRSLEAVSRNLQNHGHFPAHLFTTYLERYLDDHKYNGQSLHERIHFNALVKKLSKIDGVWELHTTCGVTSRSAKIIDAAGLTSHSYVPHIPGQYAFTGVQLHHADFGQSTILKSSSIARVVVIGGAKSAADFAYAAAKAGKSRAAFASIFSQQGKSAKFLQQSWLGQRVFHGLWSVVEAAISHMTNYDRKDGRENGLKNLRPDTTPFWGLDSPSVANKSDFFDVVAQSVRVYREDPTNPDSHKWTAEHMKGGLQRVSTKALGQSVSVATYREIAIAVGQQWVREDSAVQRDNEDKSIEA